MVSILEISLLFVICCRMFLFRVKEQPNLLLLLVRLCVCDVCLVMVVVCGWWGASGGEV